MVERRRVKRRRNSAHTYFPIISHQGDFIRCERRGRPARGAHEVLVDNIDDVDLPTMFLDINKQM